MMNHHDAPSPRLVINGSHAGCVERRRADALAYAGVPPGECEFDGRLALVEFRQRYLLFARANLAASGQRFVQVGILTLPSPYPIFQLSTSD